MKTFQLRTFAYEDAIEWIPFNRLSDVKEIGRGGFGPVYSALWLDGIRKIDGVVYNYVRTREPSCIVALKPLANSKENKFDFLKEFKSFMECKLNCSKLAIYGITQNTETNEFLMVFQYANNGSLAEYLRKNFSILNWQAKLKILKDISKELDNIHHYAEYIHADFHSGNILQDEQTYMRSYITDLGLSRKKDESVLEGDIYGVMPYIAPEVLSGEQQFTQAADIYGFGVIMAEISNGQKPFDGYEFDTNLAVMIYYGLRPGFASGTPDCYIELAKQCMESDPQKRPKACDINQKINNWLGEIASSDNNEIKKQFFDADKGIKSLPISKHPNEMYASKIIKTKLISKTIKADSTKLNEYSNK